MGTALQRNSTGALEKARYSDGSVHKYSHFVPQREEGNFCVKMSNKNEEINPVAPELLFFFNFSTPCIYNVNNTGTKQVSIMKQTAF